MTVVAMTKSRASQINADIEEALKQVAAKHALQFRTEGGVVFDTRANTLRGKWKMTGIVLEGQNTGKPSDFDSNASRVGASPDWWGQKIVSRGSLLTVVDIKPRNSKYPIICQHGVNGRSYKLSVDRVRRLLS